MFQRYWKYKGVLVRYQSDSLSQQILYLYTKRVSFNVLYEGEELNSRQNETAGNQ
jgi:hypothetical protein